MIFQNSVYISYYSDDNLLESVVTTGNKITTGTAIQKKMCARIFAAIFALE